VPDRLEAYPTSDQRLYVFGYVAAGVDVDVPPFGLSKPLLRLVLPGRYPPYVLELPVAAPPVGDP
jgi:hypothetical protein